MKHHNVALSILGPVPAGTQPSRKGFEAIGARHFSNAERGLATKLQTFKQLAIAIREFVAPSYRPELHYMRGFGPASARRAALAETWRVLPSHREGN